MGSSRLQGKNLNYPYNKSIDISKRNTGFKGSNSDEDTLSWLLDGDISIQYQVWKDLMGKKRADYKYRIANEGWGKELLTRQKDDGHWGLSYYQPKWISTHYTLLELRNLEISPEINRVRDTIDLVLKTNKSPDGGIHPIGTTKDSDVCLNGMFLNFACYFKAEEEKLETVVDFILSQRMVDGGFNCMFNRSGARHSSLHSTISVAEGICEYRESGYTYRLEEMFEAEQKCREFILLHQLFLSDRTGQIIRKEFLQLPYPWRWKFNILRGLEYFRRAGVSYDERMAPAFEVLLRKKKKDNRWYLNAHHPGQIHFEMEKPGTPSRWNTLNALRILKYFNIE